MRFRTLAIAASLSFALSHQGEAFAPQKGLDKPLATATGRAPRVHRVVEWKALATLPGWHAQWDRDTDVPLRAWGPSLPAPGATADPLAAEATARAFLSDHLDLLAPGARATDFVLVANELDANGKRTVAFAQRVAGLPVVGGSIGLLFAHDRLVMASSTALPHVQVKLPGGTLPAQTLEASAAAFLATAGYDVRTRGHGDRAVLPLVRPRGNAAAPEIEYRVVETVSVEATHGTGRWDVWLDARDGAAVARHPTLMFASGVVKYNVPDRSPSGTRSAQPAAYATHQVNGAAATAGLEGSVTWATTGNATIQPGLSGTYAMIKNMAGAAAATSLTLASGGTVIWDQSADEHADAQLDAYIYENTVKHFVLTQVNPNLTWAKGQLEVDVNEQMTCNAYSTGDDIHFFIKDSQCENTGRIADVVYHETGHSVHYNSIIPGQGQFDGSLSEGLADTLAVAITGDPGLGRGFFFTNDPLRDLNPATKKRWPQDADGEPHNEGEIIGEALWDTRVALQNKLGQTAGFQQFLKIYYSIVQRAADIPSSYAEALAADDDDGNLANGTPNQCEIDAAFGAHGLSDPAAQLGLSAPARDNFTISFSATPPTTSACGGAPLSVTSAMLDWNPRGGTGGQVPLAAADTTWSGDIPAQPDGSIVEYAVTITLSDGSTLHYPQNAADPKYQFYVGTPQVIKCWDFESGLDGWTHTGSPSRGDEWAVGAPLGVGGDARAAHGGSNVLGIDLGADDGLYNPNTTQSATSPEIDLAGARNVHLQYWRWLGVEDGAYDHATISANGTAVWTNHASQGQPEPSGEVNHIDKEWRFQDVDVSSQAASGKMSIEMKLESDPGLELAGWTVDDVCLVVLPGPGANACGNGTVDPGEDCDDGAGNGTSGSSCSATCTTTEHTEPGGCCSAHSHPAGPIGLGLLTLGLVFRRRRAATRR